MTTIHRTARSGSTDAALTMDSGTTHPLDRTMDRYADGDDAAFGQLFHLLSPRIQVFLRRLGASPDLADDLMQETFMRIHQARGSFAKGRPVLPWAYAIARNCFMSHARSTKTKMARSSVDVTEHEAATGLDSCAEQVTIAKQSAEVVQKTLSTMTLARREAFVLLRYEGMSVATAAEILGITEGALKLRAFHAYELIRAALRGMENEGDVANRTVFANA